MVALQPFNHPLLILELQTALGHERAQGTASPGNATLHRPGRDTQLCRDLVVGVVKPVAQRKDLPVAPPEFLRALGDKLGHFDQGNLPRWARRTVSNQTGDGRIALGALQRAVQGQGDGAPAPGIPPVAVAREVEHDAVQPGLERRVASEVVETTVRADERILSNLLGIGKVVELGGRYGMYHRAMARHNLREGELITRLHKAADQLGIVHGGQRLNCIVHVLKKSMKIYVASSNKNRDAVRRAIAQLIAAGHEVPYDWTPNSSEGVTDPVRKAELMGRFAAEDAWGVRQADAIVVLAHPLMNATLVEFGMAVALTKVLIVVGARAPDIRYCIFFRLPYVNHVATVEEAIEILTLNRVSLRVGRPLRAPESADSVGQPAVGEALGAAD